MRYIYDILEKLDECKEDLHKIKKRYLLNAGNNNFIIAANIHNIIETIKS